MIKKLVIMALMSALSFTSFAAGGLSMVEFGIKGGLNTDNVDIFKNNLPDYRIFTDAKLGYHLGLVSRIQLTGFHIQPEIVYNWNRFGLESEQVGSNSKSKSTVKYHNLEVPIMFGIQLLFIRAQAGPVFNVMNATSVKAGSGASAHAVEVKRPTVSYALGLGFDLLSFSLDVRFNGQFKRTAQTVSIGNSAAQSLKSNFQGWTFSLGYMF